MYDVAYHVASHFIALYFICLYHSLYVLYILIQLGGIVNTFVYYFIILLLLVYSIANTILIYAYL